MGFMDKVKAQTEVAMAKGQQAVKEGQARLDGMQAKKANDHLLRDLGEAYYASQRSGGPASAVEAAMTALDAHAASEESSGGGGADPTTGDTSFSIDDV